MSVEIELRAVEDADVAIFFSHFQQPAALRMAAFISKDAREREAFEARWTRIRADEAVEVRTILAAGDVVGHVASFEHSGQREVTYWIDQAHWGRGITTRALRAFLQEESRRPLHARIAKDNVGSTRVLEKCGFSICGEDEGHSWVRGETVAEYIMVLGEAS